PTLQAKSLTIDGRIELHRVHLRFYTAADWQSRWGVFFGWSAGGWTEDPAPERPALKSIIGILKERQLRQNDVAAAIGVDRSFLSKVLRGLKPAPPRLLSALEAYVGSGARVPLKPVGGTGLGTILPVEGSAPHYADAYRRILNW